MLRAIFARQKPGVIGETIGLAFQIVGRLAASAAQLSLAGGGCGKTCLACGLGVQPTSSNDAIGTARHRIIGRLNRTRVIFAPGCLFTLLTAGSSTLLKAGCSTLVMAGVTSSRQPEPGYVARHRWPPLRAPAGSYRRPRNPAAAPPASLTAEHRHHIRHLIDEPVLVSDDVGIGPPVGGVRMIAAVRHHDLRPALLLARERWRRKNTGDSCPRS